MSGESSSSSQVRSATSYQVTVGNAVYTQTDESGMQSLVIENHVDLVDMLTMRLGGSEDEPTWNFTLGDDVEARVGSGNVLLFKGHVTALEPSFQAEGGATITIRALDPVHILGRGRKTRFWEEVRDSDIVTEVGQECGLTVQADPTDETHSYVLQRNESNVAFLKRLAARNNFQLRVEEGKLIFKENQYSGEETEISLGDDLHSLRMSFNSVDQVSQVVVRGWDINEKQEIVGTATSTDITRIGGGNLGLSDCETAFGSTTAYVTDVPVSSQTQATAIATAELERLARQFARGSGSVQGNDAVRAGAVIRFSGLSSPYDGLYYVVASRHIISSATGYTTEFTFCSNSFGS